jgi:Lon protease-like protein
MVDRRRETRLALLPLPDLVCFPRTTVRLTLEAPRYRRLLDDVLAREEEERLIGMVLLKPAAEEEPEPLVQEVFPGGTASRIVEAEDLSGGRSTLLLHGDFRFRIEREVGRAAYREAVVEEVHEPWLNPEDAGLVAVRSALVEVTGELLDELQDLLPASREEWSEVASGCDFEELVNRLAAEIDVPAVRKLELLIAALPERALAVLSILKARKRVLDLLRPYRRADSKPELN